MENIPPLAVLASCLKPPFMSLIPPVLKFTSARMLVRVLAACSLPLLLGSCGESSRLKAEIQSLNAQQAEIQKQISAYEQHIDYYRRTVPGALNIAGTTDPAYAQLAEIQGRLDAEAEMLTAQVASFHAHLKLLREESAQEHQLNDTK